MNIQELRIARDTLTKAADELIEKLTELKPDEPVKPREWWILESHCALKDRAYSDNSDALNEIQPNDDIVHVVEIMPNHRMLSREQVEDAVYDALVGHDVRPSDVIGPVVKTLGFEVSG